MEWLKIIPEAPDFIIELGELKIPCHKSIMKQASLYFAALLSSQMMESQNNYVKLKGTEKQPFLALCKFVYTGQLDITDSTIYSLAEASSMYQFTAALKLVQTYLSSKVSSTTWCDILKFSDTHQLTDVFAVALRYILWYFPEEVEKDLQGFQSLAKSLVSKVLGHSHLNCRCETDVLAALDKWLSYDPDSRLKDFPELFKSALFLDSMSVKELHEMLGFPCVEKCEEVKSLILEKANQRIGNSITDISNPSERKGPLVMLCVGGDMCEEKGSQPCKDIVEIDPHTAEVKTYTTLAEVVPNQRAKMGFRACCVDTDLYVTGGETVLGRNTWNMDVWKFSSFTSSWALVTQLQQPRRHHSMCTLNKEIYLIGGFGRFRQVLSSMEKYNPAAEEWTSLADLLQPEVWPAVLVCYQEIYVIKNSMQKYNPVTDQWTIVTYDLPFLLSYQSAVFVGCSIYMKCLYDKRLVKVDIKTATPISKSSSRTATSPSQSTESSSPSDKTSSPDEVTSVPAVSFLPLSAKIVAEFPGAPEGQLIAFKGRVYCVGGAECQTLQFYDPENDQVSAVGKLDLPVVGFSLLLQPFYPLPL